VLRNLSHRTPPAPGLAGHVGRCQPEIIYGAWDGWDSSEYLSQPRFDELSAGNSPLPLLLATNIDTSMPP